MTHNFCFLFRADYTKAIKSCTKKCLKNITLEDFSFHQKRIKNSFDNKCSAIASSDHKDEMKVRLRAAMQDKVVHNTSQRFGLTFKETFKLDEVDTSVELCESCYIHLHDEVCHKTLAIWKKDIKTRIMFDPVGSNLITSLTKKRKFKDATKMHYSNILEARKAHGNDDGWTETDLHMSCLPDSASYRQAYHWLANFIAMVGDQAPNRDNKVQLPGLYTKSSIYTMYRHHVSEQFPGDEHEILSKSSFLSIWKNIFPMVTLTKYCHVSGKCSACHWLYERQEVFRSANELDTIRYFANVHKVMIEMERSTYMKKRQQAQEHPNLYMSLIIDGMSQDHCCLPYCANKVTPNTVMKQKIMGAKQHGFAKSFYRTFPHIPSGTNVAVEVLLHEIEKRMKYCVKNNKPFPLILYLQIDGGPENTSKTFYAVLDQLVKNGVFKKIKFVDFLLVTPMKISMLCLVHYLRVIDIIP